MKTAEKIKSMYQKFAENRIIASVFFGGHFLAQKIQNVECRTNTRKITHCDEKQRSSKKNLNDLCVATICDDMTWQNLKQECQAYSLTPRNWKDIFEEKQPDVFLCESAWTGLKEQGSCWHGRIYKNNRLLFENRKNLLDILECCKVNNIPTIFWNKEDPTFFNSERYDFKDTALKFEYIFTTAKECVEEYQKLGHTKVDVLSFGFSPYLFNPLNSYPKEDKAVFAGSWFEEEKERCKDLTIIFDTVAESGILLEIYDRQTGTTKEGRRFPEKYQENVHPAVPFEKLGQVLKKSKYAINVNTVVNSETMFARRVLEFMAMNTMVISNESIGMKQLFEDRIWFAKEEFYAENLQEKCLKNLEYVFEKRTNQKLFSGAFQKVGVLAKQESAKVVIWPNQQEKVPAEFDYIFFWDEKTNIPDFGKMLPHFCYLPTKCGIKVSTENKFVIWENSDNVNVLFPKEMFSLILEHPEARTQKYYLGVSVK